MTTPPEAGLDTLQNNFAAANGKPAAEAQAIAFCGGSAWAGSELVNFRQAGRGRPLLLLGPGAASGTEPELALALARRFRVVMPAIALRTGPVELTIPIGETIRSFLDTLGFELVVLIATPPYAAAALAYALMDPERVDHLVIFADDRLGADSPNPLLNDRLAKAGVQLAALAWPDSQPAGMRDACLAAAIEEVTGFLAAG